MEKNIQSLFEAHQAKSIMLRHAPLADRISRLKALKKWILNNQSGIREAVYTDLKKPHTDTDISEVFVVVAEINKALRQLKTWTRPKQVSPGLTYAGTSAYVRFEPKGTALIISPWNFPFNLVGAPLVSALAAGCTTILKPSEHTPATSALIAQMVDEVFAPDIVAVVEGAVEETTQLLALPFDHIFFTGSTKVGKIVMAAAAKNLSSVTLELGGKSPAIVDKTAKIEDAAKKIVWGKFNNNGQTCIAPDYIYVHQSVKQQLVDAIKKELQAMFDPQHVGYEKSESYSRLVHQGHAERLESMLSEALSNGGRLEAGGEVDTAACFMAPTIVSDVAPDSELWQEEIFGPILPVNTFQQIDEVIRHINANPKPLALYIFSKNRKLAHQVELQTSSGAVCHNEVVIQYTHPGLPFGGVNASGIGKSHGFYGFQEFSNAKAVLKQRTGFTNAMLFYPPYSRWKKKLVSFIIRYLS